MVEQHPKPSYSEIMRELDIEVISPNNRPICHSNLGNLQKTGIKLKNLKGLEFRDNYIILLRYCDNHFYISIISQKREKGVFQRD